MVKYITPRQVEILDRVCVGKPNKIIAHELGIADATVKMHVRTLMKIFDATNRTMLAYKAGKERP